ncbi:MAG: hypothetical protein GTO63_16170 [Anaerolineae bacterium]|nr:hypothetical protein [Anaerolineae bacterium]NIN96352.1 hypothetical protein [Anaerolineae bacterium]NIQ79387.1 hypothetical protein [Anaerolineae bacterium]
MQDQVSIKRLVLVKRLYLEGVEKAAHQHNYSDQMLAVINLFLAVESLMGAVVLSVDEQPGEAIGTKGYVGRSPSPEQVSGFNLGKYHRFEQLFNQVVAVLRSRKALGVDESLFRWDAVDRLRRARNDAQHAAKAPHPSDLPELAEIADKFIDRVLATHFFACASSLAEISLADLIEDEVLREYLRHAEAALVQGRLKVCALVLRVALLLGRLKRRYDWWRDRGGGSVIDDYDASLEITQDWGIRTLNNRDTRLLSGIMRQVFNLPGLFDNWVLGLHSVDRKRLTELTPRLVRHPPEMKRIPPSDEIVVVGLLENLISDKGDWTGPDFRTTPSKNSCLWLFDFTTETMLRWEREQRGRYTAIDLRYLEALPNLESIESDSASGTSGRDVVGR